MLVVVEPAPNGGSGRNRFDELGATHGSLAGSRLDEALAFGWCACFPQLANPHFTAIASTPELAQDPGSGSSRPADLWLCRLP